MRPIRASLLSLALAAEGCGPPPPLPAAPTTPAAALVALEAETGAPWKVRWHPALGTPALLEGHTAPLLMPGVNAQDILAHQFLADHSALFGLDPSLDTLVSSTIETDSLGMVHLRMVQQHQGLPVADRWLGMHFAADGGLARIEGCAGPLPALPHLEATQSSDVALAAALATLPPGAVAQAPALLVDPIAGADPASIRARLAWRVEVAYEDPSAPARDAVYVDAGSGAAYRTDELLDTLTGTGLDVFGQRRSFTVEPRESHFVMVDATQGDPAQEVESAGAGAKLPGTLVASTTLDSWDITTEGRGAAVDAAAFMAATQQYFASVHGRLGATGAGAGMHATVHFGAGFAGTFYDGARLVFGDGDGRLYAPLAGALDVVAHEFSHGVTESAAQLGRAGEPGALNEAVCDLFACFVEAAAAERDLDGVTGTSGNWTIGERVWLAGAYGIRDLADPHRTSDPAHTSEQRATPDDRGAIHANSTIASHAAYLMTVGGTNSVSNIHVTGIGAALAERVWYRALTRYLGPSSDFVDAADATGFAAADLTGAASPAVQSVLRAWQAVGVSPTE